MTVAIRRRSDNRFLMNWGGGLLRYSAGTYARFRSEGHAQSVIRIDLGRDLADFEIVPVSALTGSLPESVVELR